MTLSDLQTYEQRIEALFTDEHAEAVAVNVAFGWLISAAEAGRTVDPQELLDYLLVRAERVHDGEHLS